MTSTLTRFRESATRGTVVAGVALATLGTIAVGSVVHVLGDDTAAAAATAPYSDPRSGGLLTLCTAAGQPVTSGRIDDRPFADAVLSDVGLPEGIDTTGAVASVFAHQPRAGVGSDEFSGTAITAAHVLADPTRPAVPVGPDSWSIGDFTLAFPADHDGFVQLRVLLGTASAGTLQEERYASADLQVRGGTWRLVHGGTADCSQVAQLTE